MMKRIIIAGGMLFFAVSHLWSASCGPIVANPINLNYKFGLTEGDGKPWREAADPVIEMWGDDYYLFASKSSGYWRSHNLADWEYIAAPSIETINEYAPTVCAIDGYLYYMASDVNRIFRTATPADGTSWREVECRFKSDSMTHVCGRMKTRGCIYIGDVMTRILSVEWRLMLMLQTAFLQSAHPWC